jgi:hypothetical protein
MIFKVCIQKDPYAWGLQIYQLYSRSIQHYFKDSVLQKLQQVENQVNAVQFIQEWNNQWTFCSWAADICNKIFMYLNRFVIPSKHLRTINEEWWYQFIVCVVVPIQFQIEKHITHLYSNKSHNDLIIKSCLKTFESLTKNSAFDMIQETFHKLKQN